MGLFSILKKMTGFEDQNKTLSKTISNDSCLVKVKLDEHFFMLLAKHYYRGGTSYKSIFREVFDGSGAKTIEVMQKASKKAESGCGIETTFVQFYMDTERFIEIPFDIYSDKRDLPIRMRNTRTWNRNNILRILKYYPTFRKYDSSIVLENTNSRTKIN